MAPPVSPQSINPPLHPTDTDPLPPTHTNTPKKLHKYGPLLLLNFGNSCALLSFCMTDVFYLRCLALIATSCGGPCCRAAVPCAFAPEP